MGADIVIRPSKSGTRRIRVGLSWDDTGYTPPARIREPYAKKPKTLLGRLFRHLEIWGQEMSSIAPQTAQGEKKRRHSSKSEDAKGRDTQYSLRDLDLMCFIYDGNGKFIRVIGPDPDNLIDPHKSVYHSGEEFTGEGVYDDESICIEADSILDEYVHFIFVIASDSNLSLSQCGNFGINVMDGADNKICSETVTAEESQHNSAYVFARISRSQQDWSLHKIAAYGDFDTQWSGELKKYL